MRRLFSFVLFASLAGSLLGSVLVDVVTIKPEQSLIEYQLRDDRGTADTADDVVLRHGDQVSVTITETTTLAELHAAARADAQAKGLLPQE